MTGKLAGREKNAIAKIE